MSEELKPCAHCGDEKPDLYRRPDIVPSEPWGITCRTTYCGVMVRLGTKEDAITAWNSRASSASDKVVEGLREAVSVAAEELSKMVSDNARLRSALEPFAYAFNRDNPASLITVHDLRMAHEAFTASLPASPSAEPKP